MTASRFHVLEVFDIAGRSGFLASGRVSGEPINAGTLLRDPVSGRAVRVLGVEFAGPEDLRQGKVTLLLERPADVVSSGTVLDAAPIGPAGTASSGVLRRHTYLLGEAHDDVRPAFYIEEGVADSPGAAEQIEAAEAALREAQVIFEVETEFGRVGPPSFGLATWAQFRQRHFVDGQPLPVRSIRERVIPAGWRPMQDEIERARGVLRGQMIAILRGVTGVEEPSIVDDRGPTRLGAASVDWSEESYGFHIDVTATADAHDPAVTAEAMRGALGEDGWRTTDVFSIDGHQVVEGDRDAFAIQAVIEPMRVTLIAYSPAYQARAGGDGPLWVAGPRTVPFYQVGNTQEHTS